jgi:hypothetical protein
MSVCADAGVLQRPFWACSQREADATLTSRLAGYMASRVHEYRVSDPLVDIGILKECFERTWSPHSKAKKLRVVLPRHNSIGFPCASLECLAVALLEVVKDDAPCELDGANL